MWAGIWEIRSDYVDAFTWCLRAQHRWPVSYLAFLWTVYTARSIARYGSCNSKATVSQDNLTPVVCWLIQTTRNCLTIQHHNILEMFSEYINQKEKNLTWGVRGHFFFLDYRAVIFMRVYVEVACLIPGEITLTVYIGKRSLIWSSSHEIGKLC